MKKSEYDAYWLDLDSLTKEDSKTQSQKCNEIESCGSTEDLFCIARNWVVLSLMDKADPAVRKNALRVVRGFFMALQKEQQFKVSANIGRLLVYIPDNLMRDIHAVMRTGSGLLRIGDLHDTSV